MRSSCCSNPAWLHVPSAVLLNWFTPNTLLLNHSFGRNHPYKVYIKTLHSVAIWKPVAQMMGSHMVVLPHAFTTPGCWWEAGTYAKRGECSGWSLRCNGIWNQWGDVNIVRVFRHASRFLALHSFSASLWNADVPRVEGGSCQAR